MRTPLESEVIRRLADASAARRVDDDLYYWLLDLASDLPADTVEEASTMCRVDQALGLIFMARDGSIDGAAMWARMERLADIPLVASSRDVVVEFSASTGVSVRGETKGFGAVLIRHFHPGQDVIGWASRFSPSSGRRLPGAVPTGSHTG